MYCGWSPVSGWEVVILWYDRQEHLYGKQLGYWMGQRTLKISDMAITNDGKLIITMCRETVILLLDREAKVERLIEEGQPIATFSLSRDGRFFAG
uniref:Uncharacterized protein n=1 Tax=Nelumbo nucifera TaxID=4432 RepID=A0A822YQB9_NELNU|nr:TPA_asm: hypothetical protein HUJ06_012652 [Nelumbo nucifera]